MLSSAFLSRVANFSETVASQASGVVSQTNVMEKKVDSAIDSTLSSDKDISSVKFPVNEMHPEQIRKIKLNMLLSLTKILANELHSVGSVDLPFANSVKAHFSLSNGIKNSIDITTKQLGDVVQTNSVPLATGNSFRLLTGDDLTIARSVLTRAGTAVRLEAPAIVDSACSRIMFAHTLLEKADLLVNTAVNMINSAKEDIAIVSGSNIVVSAKTNIKLVSGKIDLNPDNSSAAEVELDTSSKVKKMIQIPQWDNIQPIGSFLSPDEGNE